MKNLFDLILKKPLLLDNFKNSELLKLDKTELDVLLTKYCEKMNELYNFLMGEIHINNDSIESFVLNVYNKIKNFNISIVENSELETLNSIYLFDKDIRSDILSQDELHVMDSCTEEKCKINFSQYAIDINVFINFLIVDVRKMIENSYEKYLQNEIKSLKTNDTKTQIANFILSGYFPKDLFGDIADGYNLGFWNTDPIFDLNNIQEAVYTTYILKLDDRHSEEIQIHATAITILMMLDSIKLNSYTNILQTFKMGFSTNKYLRGIFACKMLMNIGTKLNLNPYSFIKEYIIPKNRVEIFKDKLAPYILPALKNEDEFNSIIEEYFNYSLPPRDEITSMVFEKYLMTEKGI